MHQALRAIAFHRNYEIRLLHGTALGRNAEDNQRGAPLTGKITGGRTINSGVRASTIKAMYEKMEDSLPERIQAALDLTTEIEREVNKGIKSRLQATGIVR